MAREANAFQKVMEELESTGLLLLADKYLPSVTTIVTGEPVRGSWWSHPRSHQIFAVATRLGDDPNVTTVKLVSGKVTFVHRRLWSALLAVARSRASWQCKGLTAKARSLLVTVEKEGQIRMDQWLRNRPDSAAWKRAAGELEKRLLVCASEVHTESGAHSKALGSWEHWARPLGVDPETPDVEAGRSKFERTVADMNRRTGGSGRLPWQ